MSGSTPTHNGKHFTCPHPECQIDAQQIWRQMRDQGNNNDAALTRSTCVTCDGHAYWINGALVWPAPRLGEQASPGLPPDVQELYDEARAIVALSPRAAAALLRLAVERLVAHLGERGGKLDQRIGRLASSGLIPRRTVDALDAVRITGNNAVHEGQIDPAGADDLPVALLLFHIVNLITDDTLGMTREIAHLVGDKRRTTPTTTDDPTTQ